MVLDNSETLLAVCGQMLNSENVVLCVTLVMSPLIVRWCLHTSHDGSRRC